MIASNVTSSIVTGGPSASGVATTTAKFGHVSEAAANSIPTAGHSLAAQGIESAVTGTITTKVAPTTAFSTTKTGIAGIASRVWAHPMGKVGVVGAAALASYAVFRSFTHRDRAEQDRQQSLAR